MADDPHYYTRNIEVDHLITRDKQRRLKFQRKQSLNKIILAEQLELSENCTCLVGGESGNPDQDAGPAIVIEKKGDQISRIVVTCPCGRQSELVFEYEEDSAK